MSGKRVAIIDDDVTIGDMLKTGLEVLGYIVNYVETETELWKVLNNTPPDVILMDIGMPGIDGISLCRNIKLSPRLKQIPVVMVTAFTDSRTFHDAMLFGADGLITKPFEIEAVHKEIESILAKKNKE